MTFLVARLFHLLFMAFWLASIVKEVSNPLGFVGDKNYDKKLYLHRVQIVGMLGTISGVGAILSGGLLGHLMGFDNLPSSIDIGFIIAIVMAVVATFGLGGCYHNIGKAIEQDAELSELEILSKRLTYWSVLLLVLWLSVFLLMVLRHFI